MSDVMHVGFYTSVTEGNQLADHVTYWGWHICDSDNGKVLGIIFDKELAGRVAELSEETDVEVDGHE